MQVAFLTHEPFFPPSGGGSAAAAYLVRELVRRGHQVDVFAPQTTGVGEVERTFAIRLRPFVRWPMGRTTPWWTVKYLAYPSALARQVRETVASGARYDVLLAQHSISSVAAAQVKRALGIPTVFNLLDCLTGFMETWPAWQMPRAAARALVRYELGLPARHQADAVLTVSDALRNRVIERGFPADRVRSAYYGYDAALFRRGPDFPAPSPEPLVVMHGSFDRHHLGHIAREALVSIHRARPDVRFRFIGPETPSLRECLAEAGRRAPGLRVETTGFVPYDQIPRRLSDAWVGITPYEPSTGTHCAFVAKTVEYLALGIPVVSTPLESAVAYYAGLPGIRFSTAQGAGFAEAVLGWLALPDATRTEATIPTRNKVRAELDWPVLCGRACEFLEQTLRPGRG